MFMSVSCCVQILRRHLSRCAYERLSLKTAFCTNELIKSQTQASFCLVLVNSCKIAASRTIIQMSLGNTQQSNSSTFHYIYSSTLSLQFLSLFQSFPVSAIQQIKYRVKTVQSCYFFFLLHFKGSSFIHLCVLHSLSWCL